MVVRTTIVPTDPLRLLHWPVSFARVLSSLFSSLDVDVFRFLTALQEERGLMMPLFDLCTHRMFEQAGRVATEGVEAVRTVNSNNLTYDFLDAYAAELDKPFKTSIKTSQIAGVAFGWAEFFTFAMWAIAFSYGSYLVDNGDCDFADMMKAISAVAFGAMMFGQVAAMMPDAATGQIAATKIFRLLDRKPLIDYTVCVAVVDEGNNFTAGVIASFEEIEK